MTLKVPTNLFLFPDKDLEHIVFLAFLSTNYILFQTCVLTLDKSENYTNVFKFFSNCQKDFKVNLSS